MYTLSTYTHKYIYIYHEYSFCIYLFNKQNKINDSFELDWLADFFLCKDSIFLKFLN